MAEPNSTQAASASSESTAPIGAGIESPEALARRYVDQLLRDPERVQLADFTSAVCHTWAAEGSQRPALTMFAKTLQTQLVELAHVARKQDTRSAASAINDVGYALQAIQSLADDIGMGNTSTETLALCIINMVPTMFRKIDSALALIGQSTMGGFSEEARNG